MTADAPGYGHDTAPIFDPDPDLVDHLEGNERAIRRYRASVLAQRDEAIREALQRGAIELCRECGSVKYVDADCLCHGAVGEIR